MIRQNKSCSWYDENVMQFNSRASDVTIQLIVCVCVCVFKVNKYLKGKHVPMSTTGVEDNTTTSSSASVPFIIKKRVFLLCQDPRVVSSPPLPHLLQTKGGCCSSLLFSQTSHPFSHHPPSLIRPLSLLRHSSSFCWNWQ